MDLSLSMNCNLKYFHKKIYFIHKRSNSKNRVHSDCPNCDVSNYNLPTRNLSPTNVRITICQNVPSRHFFFWAICRLGTQNNAGLSAGELLGAPFGRKPLLVFYCSIVGHYSLLEQRSNVV